MEKITAVVCGKEYTLRFDMESWEKIEDDVCMIDDLGEKLAGKGRIRAIAQVFAILAKADFGEIWKDAKPGEMRAMTKAIWAATARSTSRSKKLKKKRSRTPDAAHCHVLGPDRGHKPD